MGTLLQDLRYALRTLRRTPVFTLIAVLTLATAIGANTVIFSVLNGVVLRSLQYDASDRLFGIWERSEGGDYRLGSYPTFRDWRAQNNVFDALAFVRGSSVPHARKRRRAAGRYGLCVRGVLRRTARP